jgi:hypothetical protein
VPPPLAVSVVLAPLQIFTLAGAIDALGNGFTVTMRDVDAVHPLISVAVTV